MTPADILAAIESERLRLCDHLDDLDDAQWRTPSLCPAWTVRDVVAHLTVPTRATWRWILPYAARSRGDFHRMSERMATDRAAAFTPAELVAQLRETAGSPRRMPLSGPMDPLLDILVHGQDIARPLGRRHPMPVDLAAEALRYATTNAFHGAPKRLAGHHLTATDTPFTYGTGPAELRDTAENLLLVAMGRDTAARSRA
jgi:uncharacterized protein (TIGR03083 family)